MIKQQLQFGSKTIDYDVIFSERSTLGIIVNPEMDVLVKASNWSQLGESCRKST